VSGPRFQSVVTWLLLLFGLQLSLVIGGGAWPPNRRVIGCLVVAALVALVAAVFHRAVQGRLDAAAAAMSRRRAVIASALFALSISYLYFTARQQGRTFSLKYQD
jgi:hypothetical protein